MTSLVTIVTASELFFVEGKGRDGERRGRQRMEKNELKKQTRKDLLALARQKGIKGASRLRKEELIARMAEAIPAKPLTTHRPPPSLAVSDLPNDTLEPAALSSHTLVVPDPSRVIPAQPVSTVPPQAINAQRFPAPEVPVAPSSGPELPSTYHDNRLVLLARDPYLLYAYW